MNLTEFEWIGKWFSRINFFSLCVVLFSHEDFVLLLSIIAVAIGYCVIVCIWNVFAMFLFRAKPYDNRKYSMVRLVICVYVCLCIWECFRYFYWWFFPFSARKIASCVQHEICLDWCSFVSDVQHGFSVSKNIIGRKSI